MSALLYSLGKWSFQHKRLVLFTWLGVLLGAVAMGLLLNKGTDDAIIIPGTESQAALDKLNQLFPQVSGSSAQIVVTTPDGHSINTPAIRQAVSESVDRQRHLDQVAAVTSPFDPVAAGAISPDRSSAIIIDQMTVQQSEVRAATKAALQREAGRLQHALGGEATVSVGGDAFANRVPKPSPTEAIGVVIALILLFAFFRSMGAAFVPICTAVLGVVITQMLIDAATSTMSIMSTAPMLATMIGLAVGIDYALFVVSSHRDQLACGMAPEESAGRAVATAGSAVVFAGATVMVALIGLFVARIPFLTIMGACAASGVGVAVMISLSLTPAVFGFFGDRLGPKRRVKRGEGDPGLAGRWVNLVIRRPSVTIAAVLVVVLALAWPVTGLKLALPGNESEPTKNVARGTFDLVAQKFGPGYNGPLMITVNLPSSPTTMQDLTGLQSDLSRIDGVAATPLVAPNPGRQIGIVQVIPSTAPDSPSTADLVHRLRAAGPQLERKHGLQGFSVTGVTAVQVDISNKLSSAMLPFGVFVVGLSLVLLVIVFRSITVPLKATLGYVLSVLAALGATAAVFVKGWGAAFFGVAHVGPVVSFLPIIVMGVLFGLAMDYEVFLVSRTAEEYHESHDPEHAICRGFQRAAPVVTTAALIMLAVFISFIPDESSIIKPMAFALTVGVFVDAFLVRMTLVPAVLRLLGHSAWWLPRSWERRLPRLDVEGHATARPNACDEANGAESLSTIRP